MKKLLSIILALLTILLISCSQEGIDPNQPGCLSGLTNDGTRYQIMCCTKQQFEEAKRDPSKGINNNYQIFTFFEDVQWRICEDCK